MSCFAVVCVSSTVTKRLCNTHCHTFYVPIKFYGNTAQFSRKHNFNVLYTLIYPLSADRDLRILYYFGYWNNSKDFQTIPYGLLPLPVFSQHQSAKDHSRVVSPLVCVQNFDVPNLGPDESLPFPVYIASLNPSMQMLLSISNILTFPPKFNKTMLQIFATSIMQLTGRVKQLFNDIYIYIYIYDHEVLQYQPGIRFYCNDNG
jgi:hypothetical protein